ncbi:MAG TPA: serine hydrolase domain-containing protein [Stackebrandtia sp.]|uniref:serine hydrolase domain-containing protein n=1 Tax=Stackebrandtia sp. TaxID=2023065 RepID=UPI002D697ADF|nr:serine hydrolase domain-containing protein [Stackebrandtia sp.]HZE37935.1 serine hydrolase domain-containing protein [Stackebrandtia sp.]
MSNLREVLTSHTDRGTAPGAVALVARGDRVEVEAVGTVDVEGTAPMRRDSIFRLTSVTKPITAAAVMALVDDGKIAWDDPIAKWIPELANPMVVRDPTGPIDDVEPADRPITVFDLLTFRAGWGFPSGPGFPAAAGVFALARHVLQPLKAEPVDTWVEELSRIPLLYQPGRAWLYGTGSVLQGVLVARATGQRLGDFMSERIFAPLGMKDTGFFVPRDKRDQFTSLYTPNEDGGLDLVDAPDGQWSADPRFHSGAGGLVSTVDDWWAFARMMLGEGTLDGKRILSRESVRDMTTNHLTAGQRAEIEVFTEGQGWGFGGTVDVDDRDPWTVPGRYGWVGGTGVTAHLTPSTRDVVILLTQRCSMGAAPTEMMRDVWRYAAQAG